MNSTNLLTQKTGLVYEPQQILEMLRVALQGVYPISYQNKKGKIFNIPCSFDIETTSTYSERSEKVAFMYEWTLGVNGEVMIGRTWQEFITVINSIVEFLNLNKERTIVIYVHNLAYEFQWFRKLFEWDKVFSIDKRKPIYARTKQGVEFRCSYLLSGYNLASLGTNLQRYKCEKMVGDLDYSLIRHSGTPLTEKEIGYCINDVMVVMCYIQEQIENCGDITKIPMTKTGFVRNYCRNQCLYNGEESHKQARKNDSAYQKIMSYLTIEPREYELLKQAFQGGYTHANPFYMGKVEKDVGSFDFTSSYPYVLVSELMPMSKGEFVTITSKEQFEQLIKQCCCMFEVEFTNIVSSETFDSYISVSHCRGLKNPVVNNGRIVQADKLITTITEQDYMIISKIYQWENMKIGDFVKYRKEYLPTSFVKAILKLYEDKTTLKNVKGKEYEYLLGKEMLNSCYGMTVTDICRDNNEYKDEWNTKPVDVIKALNSYNKSLSRFLFYPWGVWCTAYARKNLWTGILEFREDYIYSDTDSIKVLNMDKHMDYINRYNEFVKRKLYKAMDYHKLPYSKIEPLTIKGIPKLLGVWDYEGTYTKFKTLGAKRYMVEEDGEINITVSGLNKKVCVPYLVRTFGKDGVFNAFNNDLYIPPKFTGKNTHTYIDEELVGQVVDYLGNVGVYHELSSVHLSESDYSLSIADTYADYCFTIQSKGVDKNEKG